MFSSKSTEPTTPNTIPHVNGLADRAAEHAELAIEAGRQVADDTFNGLSAGVQAARRDAAPMLDRMADKATAMRQRSSELLHNGSQQLREQTQQLREQAHRASDSTLGYVRQEPAKALLIAAASGAVLMALIGWTRRSRGG